MLRFDITYAVGMLGRYQSNPSMDHSRATKKVMRYVEGAKDYMMGVEFTKNNSDSLIHKLIVIRVSRVESIETD